jgi:hypothetical protein
MSCDFRWFFTQKMALKSVKRLIFIKRWRHDMKGKKITPISDFISFTQIPNQYRQQQQQRQ